MLLATCTSPVPVGLFDSPISVRHVLCLHLGDPVPVSYRARLRASWRAPAWPVCVVPSTRLLLDRVEARGLVVAESVALAVAGNRGGKWRRTTRSAIPIHIRDA
jgi:AraC family transcriptional regulator